MQDRILAVSTLQKVLEKATGLSGSPEEGGGETTPRGETLHSRASVKFPEGQVRTVDRVNMWIDAGNICLRMWPAEIQEQYAPFYSNPRTVESVIALADTEAWEVNSNFHIAYRSAPPTQRWYPHLGELAQLRRWVKDFGNGCAGAKTHQEIAEPGFRSWLVERGYAYENELPSLDKWLDDHPKARPLLRPGVQVQKTWPSTDSVASDHADEFTAEVREAIDRVLSALGEPKLSALWPEAPVKKPSKRPPCESATRREPAARRTNACPTCFTVHAGECL